MGQVTSRKNGSYQLILDRGDPTGAGYGTDSDDEEESEIYYNSITEFIYFIIK